MIFNRGWYRINSHGLVVVNKKGVEMLIYKTYKFRMYSDSIQVQKINSFLESKRFVYNHYLNEKAKDENLKINQTKKIWFI